MHSIVVVSAFATLLGVFLSELFLVECGFKVFTTLLVLKLITSKLKAVHYTAALILALLLLFYTSIINSHLALLACVLSCVLVAIYSSRLRGRANAFPVLFSWCFIAISTLWLLVPDAVIKSVFIPVLPAIMVLLSSKSTARYESRLARTKLPRLRAIEKRLAKTGFTLKYVYKSSVTRIKHVKTPRWKPPRVEVREEIAKILSKLSSRTSIITGPTKVVHMLLEAVFKSSVAMETYVNSLVGNVVALLIESTTRFSTVERRVSSVLYAMSLHVERLQHEIERALVFLLSLISILLLAAIVFYVIYTARLAQ